VARLFKRFRADAAGAVALEYALIGSLVSIAVIAGALIIGSSLNADFADIATRF
jgi:pilus assembly protein Flp/PilA